MGELNINSVTRQTQKAVDEILKSDGIRGISCDDEHTKLSGLLAGTKKKDDCEYIRGFMLEWEDRKAAAQKEKEENITPPKKDDLTPEPDKQEDLPEPTPPKKEDLPEPTPPKKEDLPEPTPQKNNIPKPKKTSPKPATPSVADPDHIDNKGAVQTNNADPDHIDNKGAIQTNNADPDHIDNKGAVQQSGVGNINVAPGATVIINSDKPVGGVNVNPNPPETPEPEESKTIRPLTAREINAARTEGEVVADLLFGYTSNYDQADIQEIIKNVNPDNVVEFLRGYANKLKEEQQIKLGDLIFGGAVSLITRQNFDRFFEQMITESDFPEKQEIMHHVAKCLEVHLEAKYGENTFADNTLDHKLAKPRLNERDAVVLDNITRDALNNNIK